MRAPCRCCATRATRYYACAKALLDLLSISRLCGLCVCVGRNLHRNWEGQFITPTARTHTQPTVYFSRSLAPLTHSLPCSGRVPRQAERGGPARQDSPRARDRRALQDAPHRGDAGRGRAADVRRLLLHWHRPDRCACLTLDSVSILDLIRFDY